MFRFTIRDVFWLTVVVALACGWYVSNERWSSRLVRSVDEGTVAWHINRSLVREIEISRLEGRPAEVVGFPDMEGLRREVQLQIETEKAASAMLMSQSLPVVAEPEP